jgi:hypothetical protein
MSQKALIIDEEQLARALHRATCECDQGSRRLENCVLGEDAGWLEESARLLTLLREEAKIREAAAPRKTVLASATQLAKRAVT